MFVSIYVVFFSGIIFVLAWIIISNKTKSASKYLKNIPGPKPIFPIGNIWDFIGGSTVFLPTFMKYLNTYGDTLIIYHGSFNKVLCTINYDILEYFYSSSEHIDKADQYKYLHNWLGNGLLTSTGPKWRAHRKMITQSFHFSILKNFVPVFETVGENFIKKLKKEVDKDSVEVSRLVSLYALDVICESAMGLKINALEDENSTYTRSIKYVCEIVVARGLSPIADMLYPFTWNFYKEKRALKVIHNQVNDVINEKIKQQNEINSSHSDLLESQNNGNYSFNKRLAFLDLLLQANINGKPLSKEELQDEVNTFMFEGHDTTSSAISFCLFMLATHPEVQEKVVKEQLEIFNGDIKEANPSFNQLNEMKYLELVIKETLRLFPSVPFFGRVLAKNVEFKGVLYPKGLGIMLFPFGMHRSPKYFPDPEKFIPERFMDQSGKAPYAYTPFSAGPRNCIGQKFAMLEMVSILSKIVSHFELRPAKPEHNLLLAAEAILISKNGIKISLRNRV